MNKFTGLNNVGEKKQTWIIIRIFHRYSVFRIWIEYSVKIKITSIKRILITKKCISILKLTTVFINVNKIILSVDLLNIQLRNCKYWLIMTF